MPYKIVSIGHGKVKVVNAQTGKVHAKSTTRSEAEKQIRLMQGVEHGMKLRKKKK